MDLSLFAALVRNLLQTDIVCLEDGRNNLLLFEQKYCYNKALQPAFTEEALSALTSGMGDHVLYGLRDDLGICILTFRFDSKAFIVGPYVVAEFDPTKTYRTLITKHMKASLSPSIQLYYNAFPIQSTFTMRKTLIACMQAFDGGLTEYNYCRLQAPEQVRHLPQQPLTEAVDYSTLYQRYELENRFLSLIEIGDTANVLSAYRALNTKGMEKYRYINAIYHNPNVGNAMLRALARKAAERGGVSVIEINEITQRAVQRTYAAKNEGEQFQHTSTMIYELTEAVNRVRHQMEAYSAPVKKAAEFLRHNFSSKISLPQVAAYVGLSGDHLSKAFKKETGVTISQYVAQIRCKQAAELLKMTDIPVQEISDYVGYPDNNYFVKVFKSQYGVTPSEYRAEKV